MSLGTPFTAQVFLHRLFTLPCPPAAITACRPPGMHSRRLGWMQAVMDAHAPEDSTGSSQVLPARGPDVSGCELSKMRTAATISLSATGSRKAPNAVVSPCRGVHGQQYSQHTLSAISVQHSYP